MAIADEDDRLSAGDEGDEGLAGDGKDGGVSTPLLACDEDRYRILSGGNQRSWGVESNPENGHSRKNVQA